MISANRKLLLCLATFASASACATSFRSDDTSLRPMSEQRIAALLVGNFLNNGGEGLETSNAPELFCESGRWARFFGQHVDRGQYSITNNSVCVMREGQPNWCRDFFSDVNGRLVVRDIAGAKLGAVATMPGPPDPTCTSGAEP